MSRVKYLGLSIVLALVAIAAALVARPALSHGENEVSGQAPDAGTALSEPMPAAEGYRLDSGDHLRIRFFDRFDRDDLNGEYVIGESGQVRLPRIGVFDARNKSAAELERDIRRIVEAKGEKIGYFSIDVTRCRPFYVAGLVNRPGSYPFLPSLTVLHAVSLAGGLYRSPMASVAEAMREKRTLTETLSRVTDSVARRARLEAERDDVPAISLPKELVQLDPQRAEEIMQSERTLLQRSREAASREKSGLESVIALTKGEAESYRVEIARIGQRIEEQTKIFNQLKKLHEEKVINQQRFFEAVTALDGVQRDKQIALAGLSHANTNLERAERDLSMLKLANTARIVKELTETERELFRLKTLAAQTRQLVYGLETLSSQRSSGQLVTYKIMRRDRSGRWTSCQQPKRLRSCPGT